MEARASLVIAVDVAARHQRHMARLTEIVLDLRNQLRCDEESQVGVDDVLLTPEAYMLDVAGSFGDGAPLENVSTSDPYTPVSLESTLPKWNYMLKTYEPNC